MICIWFTGEAGIFSFSTNFCQNKLQYILKLNIFSSNNLGECLNDEPSTDQYKYKGMLAGAIYDAEYQCRNTFPNSTVCPVPEDKFCDRMMCKVSERSCMSNGEPLADGTKCAENKVTHH